MDDVDSCRYQKLDSAVEGERQRFNSPRQSSLIFITRRHARCLKQLETIAASPTHDTSCCLAVMWIVVWKDECPQAALRS
jgi:hypothetical protein